MMLLCGQSSNLHGKSTRFCYSISLTDDIQDVSARTVGTRQSEFLAPGAWGVVRPLRLPLATGLE